MQNIYQPFGISPADRQRDWVWAC